MFVRSLRLRVALGLILSGAMQAVTVEMHQNRVMMILPIKVGCIDAQRVTDVMSYLRCSEAALLLFTFVELTAGNFFCFSSSLCTLLNMFLDQKVEEYLQLQQ